MSSLSHAVMRECRCFGILPSGDTPSDPCNRRFSLCCWGLEGFDLARDDVMEGYILASCPRPFPHAMPSNDVDGIPRGSARGAL